MSGYVEPQFRVASWPQNARVLLVEAPGAVGKSAAAAAFSELLKWPLVLAERAQVGDYTLSGLVQDAFGIENDYLRRIALGDAGIIIDSLDEALFRAGASNFFAFINNIHSVSGSRSEPGADSVCRPSVVLFSRSEAAELIRLSFSDAELPLASIHLDFFSLEGACAFIRSHLEQRLSETSGRPEYALFRSHPQPFQRLRDSRLRQIASLISRNERVSLKEEWPRVSDFLGYAPVLTAIAESLAVSNFAASRATEVDATTQSGLLQEISMAILHREQQKFRLNMEEKLKALTPASADELEPTSLYSPAEQCARLLSVVDSLTFVQTAPATLPEAIRAIYDESAREFINDHPFLRRGSVFGSTVFADYVRSMGSTDRDVALQLSSRPDVTPFNVGPFFARFVANSQSNDAMTDVREDDVLAMVSSWEQEQELSANPGDAVEPHVFLTFSDGLAMVQCDPARAEVDTTNSETFQFSVIDLSGAFQLPSRVRRWSVYTDQALLLGERRHPLEIGPLSVLIAQETVVEAENLRCTSTDRLPAIIISPKIEANYLAHTDATAENLQILSSDVAPILATFVRRNGARDSVRYMSDLSQFVDLRNVLMSFRPSRKGARTHEEYLTNRVVRESTFRRALLSDLERRQIVKRDSQWVYLETGTLTSLGFGLNDVRLGNPAKQSVSTSGQSKLTNVVSDMPLMPLPRRAAARCRTGARSPASSTT